MNTLFDLVSLIIFAGVFGLGTLVMGVFAMAFLLMRK